MQPETSFRLFREKETADRKGRKNFQLTLYSEFLEAKDAEVYHAVVGRDGEIAFCVRKRITRILRDKNFQS
jgi:hypothetical protein